MTDRSLRLALLVVALFVVNSLQPPAISAQKKKGRPSSAPSTSVVEVAPAPAAPGPSVMEHYLQFAHPIGIIHLDFPGPFGGYTFAHLPTKEVEEWGDTVTKDRVYLIDMNVSHDGTFLAPDTLKSSSDMTPFEFVLDPKHLIHAKLAPNRSREAMHQIDTNFNGVIGYGLLRQFITAFDFKKNTLTFYPLFANLTIGEQDPKAVQLPLLDDAVLTYCHCPYPTIWFEAQAAPLKPGRVQLALQQPISQVFTTALDSHTAQTIEKEQTVDPATGQKSKVGLTLAEFKLGPENIAGRSPRRAVEELPAAFHDLSVDILGTVGTDVLRTFSGMIIDPSRSKVILVK